MVAASTLSVIGYEGGSYGARRRHPTGERRIERSGAGECKDVIGEVP
jgi:hypothetical protein